MTVWVHKFAAATPVIKHPGHSDQAVHTPKKGPVADRAQAKAGDDSNAVESYVKDSYKINSALRQGETTDEVAGIDAEMSRSSLPAQTVYRAIEFQSSDPAYLPFARLERKGDTITDKGFTSTSKDKSVVDDFTPMGFKEKFVMTIKVPEGTKGLDLGDKYGTKTGMGDQGEVLLDRGATFRLLKPPRYEGSVTHLNLEVVSTNQGI